MAKKRKQRRPVSLDSFGYIPKGFEITFFSSRARWGVLSLVSVLVMQIPVLIPAQKLLGRVACGILAPCP